MGFQFHRADVIDAARTGRASGNDGRRRVLGNIAGRTLGRGNRTFHLGHGRNA